MMLRSMYSGVSGLKSNQTKMDVIGNNIANANTTAFKYSRVRFQDTFSQTQANAQAPNEQGQGGVNPKQIGLGVNIAAIDTIFEGSAIQPTGRDLDFAIEGEGFFVVSPNGSNTDIQYTRDGAFYKDYEGNLVNANGCKVMGVMNTPPELITEDSTPLDIPTDQDALQSLNIPDQIIVGGNTLSIEAFSIDASGIISATCDDGNAYYLGRVAMAKFDNPGGLEKLGNNTYSASRNSGPVQFGNSSADGFGIIRQGSLEMSNVDLANEFTEMIITSRAYQANSRIITASDQLLEELVNLKR